MIDCEIALKWPDLSIASAGFIRVEESWRFLIGFAEEEPHPATLPADLLNATDIV